MKMKDFMKSPELIERLKTFDPEKPILAQVVGVNPSAWNMYFEFTEIPSFVVLTMSHPQLIEMPIIETCDLGHKFPKFKDHPTRDGKARCPHCLATGFDALRKELGEI